LPRRQFNEPEIESVSFERLNQETAEETDVCEGKQDCDVKATKYSRYAGAAKNTVEEKEIRIGREAEVNASHNLNRFEKGKDPGETTDGKEMILVNAGVEDKVSQVSEH
jgi:hypothetical protein